MDDTTAQQPAFSPQSSAQPSPLANQIADETQPTLSYVDNYAPPATSVLPPVSPLRSTTGPLAHTVPTDSAAAAPVMPTPAGMPGMPSMTPASAAPLPPPPLMAAPIPPASLATPAQPPAMEEPSSNSPVSAGQSLEEQNIFEMLGAGEASDEEKESFLDELQQVIWEDFLENDVELLITESEKTELKQIQDKMYASDLEKQEAIVVYLEKLIPDLEDIMLEKALELKRDMFIERIAGMKDMLTGQTDKLATISQVENLVSQDKWQEAIATLNQLA